MPTTLSPTPRCAHRSEVSSLPPVGRGFGSIRSSRFSFDRIQCGNGLVRIERGEGCIEDVNERSCVHDAATVSFFAPRSLYERVRIAFSLSQPFGKAEAWKA